MVSQFGSLGYTIMGKTADLTVVQKTIIDTLHKEGKPQTFIAKEAGCSQSAVSKHVNRKLSGRKKCGRKRCTTNRENRSLMRIVKQNRFKERHAPLNMQRKQNNDFKQPFFLYNVSLRHAFNTTTHTKYCSTVFLFSLHTKVFS